MSPRPIALPFVACMTLGWSVLGCAGQGSPAPSPAPGPDSVASPSAAPHTATQGSSALQPNTKAAASNIATPQLPPPPEEIDAEAWGILSELCPIGMLQDRDGALKLGCRSAPPWKEPGTGPDGYAPRGKYTNLLNLKWDVDDLNLKPTLFIPLIKRYQGAFTRAGAEQTILFFEACRWADGVSTTGCAAIVERKGEQWSVVELQKEAAFKDCKVARRKDGRDWLVCANTLGAQWESLTTSIFYVDFTKADGSRRSRIAALGHNAFEIPCKDVPKAGENPAIFWGSGLVDLKLKKLRANDFDGDGLRDVTVELERVFEPYTPQLRANVQKQCRAKAASATDSMVTVESAAVIGKRAAFNLQFKNDGQALAPTSSTHRVMKIWDKQYAARPYTW